MKVLYVRISSVDQNTDRQKVNAKDYDWIIEDKVSGAVPFFERPGGKELIEMCLSGQVNSVAIWSIDRCGRSLLDILRSLQFFNEKGIPVHFISQGLRTRSEGKENPIAKMVISVLGIIAEMQREQIREAQSQGIAIAKAKGVYKGRKQNTKENVIQFLSKPNNSKALSLLEKGYKGSEVSKILGISETTVCKVKKFGLKKTD